MKLTIPPLYPRFNPAMVWPEPSLLTPHQTTYGNEPMTSKDNPRQPGETLGDYADRVMRATRATITDMAEELRQAHATISDLRDERDRLGAMHANQAAEIVRLGKELARDPPGSYLIRSPGVYVATLDPDPEHGLHVVKHLLKDAVVLTEPIKDGDGVQFTRDGEWVQFMRNGITDEAVAWIPPKGQQEAIRKAVAAWVDPSATPWMGMNPDRTMAMFGRMCSEAESEAARKELLVARIERLEAWARQFDGVRVYKSAITPLIGVQAVDLKPLDSMGDKA